MRVGTMVLLGEAAKTTFGSYKRHIPQFLAGLALGIFDRNYSSHLPPTQGVNSDKVNFFHCEYDIGRWSSQGSSRVRQRESRWQIWRCGCTAIAHCWVAVRNART